MARRSFVPFGGPEVPAVELNKARVIVLPIYYEVAPSFGAGSKEGAYHLLTASAELEDLDEETGIAWQQHGIHTLFPLEPPEQPEAAVAAIEAAARPHLASGKFLLSVGGDHAVSIGLIRAAAKIHPGIGVLQVDAHLDLRDIWHGSRYNHACVMRRVADDMGLAFAQVGIRSLSSEEHDYIKKNDFKPFYAHRIDPIDCSWIDDVIETLPPTVYITIDLDGLDPSVIPGTGTPVPGGLSYRQLLELIRRVGRSRRVVAADINELAKIDGTMVSEFTAAKIASKILVHCL
ncbi:MAG: agmatinase [Desulfobacteraceae bacterium]|jgi:agmatinase|nr:MAG: agmatinase [Desulfobacteraceae bacterium]